MKKITLCSLPVQEEAPSSSTRQAFQQVGKHIAGDRSASFASRSALLHGGGHPLFPLLRQALSNACIVVVDDSPTIQTIVALSLAGLGACVHMFSQADGVLRWLHDRSFSEHLPRLIYLDIGLPDMDGRALLRRLRTRAELSETAIIMLSGHQAKDAPIQSRAFGANGYIAKPFQAPTLWTQTAVVLGLTSPPPFSPDEKRRSRYGYF